MNLPLEASPPAQGPSDTLVVTPDIMARLNWAQLYGNSNPVEVELGSGDGSFLAQYAALRPDRNFLGVERLLGRLRKLEKKARRGQLGNVRCLRLEASYVLEWMIEPASIHGLHVYFPDPWPKRRHWKRRLVSPSFARLAALALAPGGHLLLRTDHAGYFEQMEEVFRDHPNFEPVSPPSGLYDLHTDFEREFRAKGIPTLAATYRRKDGAAVAAPVNPVPDDFHLEESSPLPLI